MQSSTKRVAKRMLSLLMLLSLATACDRGSSRLTSEASRPSAAPARATLLRFPLGVTRDYALSLSSQLSMGSASSEVDVELAARLQLTSLAASGLPPGTEALYVLPSRVKLTSAHAAPESFLALTKELEQGFVVELREGAVQAVRMPQPSVFAANLARTVAAELGRGLAPAAAQSRWEAEGADVTGQFTAEYRALGEPGRYAVRKLRYATNKLGAAPGMHAELSLTPEVVESSGELRVREGELQRLSYSEKLKTRLLTSGEARAETSLTLEAIAGSAPVRPLPTLHDLVARMIDVSVAPASAAAADANAFDHSKIGSFTFESASARLMALSQGEPLLLAAEAKAESPQARAAREQRVAEYNRAFSALVAILRAEPASLQSARRAIHTQADSASFLIDALAGAGTDAAQAALLALADDASLSKEARARAERSATRIDTPTPATVSVLIGWLAQPTRRIHAIYGLGTQARRLREQGMLELSRSASDALGEQLKQANGSAERVHLLRGVANSGAPELLPLVRPLLTHSDAIVRGAAVEALRLMDAPEVDGIIAERLRVERSYESLRAAVNAARVRTPSVTLVGALSLAARASEDSQTRYRAASLLASWLPQRPELRAVLNELAQHDENEDVRGVAARALQAS